MVQDINNVLNPYLQAFIAEQDATCPAEINSLLASIQSQDATDGTFVRIPVCVELLEALGKVEKRNRTQLAGTIAKYIAEERCRVDPRLLEADADFDLFLFNNYDFVKSFGASKDLQSQLLDVNWKGVILKLHQALYYSNVRNAVDTLKQQGKLETVRGLFIQDTYTSSEVSDSDTSSQTSLLGEHQAPLDGANSTQNIKRSGSTESFPETFRSPSQENLLPISVSERKQAESEQDDAIPPSQDTDANTSEPINIDTTPLSPTQVSALNPTSLSPMPQSSLGSVVVPQEDENRGDFPNAPMLAASSYTLTPSFESLTEKPAHQAKEQQAVGLQLTYLPPEFDFVIFWGGEPLVEDEDETRVEAEDEEEDENQDEFNFGPDTDAEQGEQTLSPSQAISDQSDENLNSPVAANDSPLTGFQGSSKATSSTSEKDGYIELSDGIPMALKWVLLALNTKGFHDVPFTHFVINQIKSARQDSEHPFLGQWKTFDFKSVFRPQGVGANVDCERILARFFDDFNARLLLDDNFEEYVERMLSSNESDVMKSLKELEKDLIFCIRGKNMESLNNAERLLIALQGHVNSIVREWSVRMLNMIYDGHDWQRQSAFKVKVSSIRGQGNALEIDIRIPKASNPSNITADSIFLECYVPSPLRYSHKSMALLQKPTVTELKAQWHVKLRVYRFRRAGFYDYRVVYITPDAQLKTLMIESKFAHGRFIVHPNVKDESIHHVWVDMHKASWSPDRTKLSGAGTFQSIIDALPGYAKSGITTLCLMGCMERFVPNPAAPHDRASPKASLGGSKMFKLLVEKAQEYNVKVIVDATSKVALRRAHRKYTGLAAMTVNAEDLLVPHFATNGHDLEWKDSIVLNNRKKECWDLLVDDMAHWAKHHVNGCFMEGAHTWPMLLEPDLSELMRRDSDGEFHYSLREILEASVVISSKRAKRTLGYWGTTASASYANPLFVKLARTLWAKFPQFTLIGETKWNRERSMVLSGIIPSTTKLPNVIGQLLTEQVQPHPHRTGKSIIQQWYRERPKIPRGSIIVCPSSQHTFTYPHHQYELGAFAYVSLLFMLPEVPMTSLGEREASQFKVNLSNFQLGLSGTAFSQESGLRDHYLLRSAIRSKHRVLRHGQFRLLTPRVKGQEIEDAVAFIRYINDEFIICAVNTSPQNATFYVDMKALTQVRPFNDLSHSYQLEDLLVPGTPRQHYTAYELIHEPHYVKLPSFGSMMWKGHRLQASDATDRVVFNHSLSRLQMTFKANGDPVHNHVYRCITNSLQSLEDFETCLKYLIDTIVSENAAIVLTKLVQETLYHASRNKQPDDAHSEARIYHLLAKLAKSGEGTANKFALQILEENSLGPIVFVTPEVAPWSKIGGVAVMVDELTQDLASLGLDVRVISPYYNYDRDGKTGYLKKDGVKHLQNISTYVGGEHVLIGLHYLEQNGVKYYFLHNFTYFPSPYHTGSPSHQLQMVVLMAKASLEMMCQLRILPALVITNDWFTGLTPGYVRCGEFGSVFNGVTFFHLVHNLEEGYQGHIYPDEVDLLRGVHGLPEHFLVDYVGAPRTLNTSRCALLTSNQWATVSKSYRDDLMNTNPLAYLLRNFPSPFAYSNGIRVNQRLEKLKKVAPSHEAAKKMLQEKYFGYSDPSVPVFSFVGRITVQKGVHLILNAVQDLVETFHGKIMIIVGGMANKKEKYAAHCAWQMNSLRYRFPRNFWADPEAYFTDGALANLGSDFGVIPSLFEPSGIVQQEYFVAGTPVIAFSTGGLKDTVFEFDATKNAGNGFLFLAHKHPDFVYAVKRAVTAYHNPENNATLRKNARESVLDTIVVAQAWGKEFYRLRKRIWPFEEYKEENTGTKPKPAK